MDQIIFNTDYPLEGKIEQGIDLDFYQQPYYLVQKSNGDSFKFYYRINKVEIELHNADYQQYRNFINNSISKSLKYKEVRVAGINTGIVSGKMIMDLRQDWYDAMFSHFCHIFLTEDKEILDKRIDSVIKMWENGLISQQTLKIKYSIIYGKDGDLQIENVQIENSGTANKIQDTVSMYSPSILWLDENGNRRTENIGAAESSLSGRKCCCKMDVLLLKGCQCGGI